MKNLYEVLGVEKDADKAEIKLAFRRMAGKLHPDKENGDKKKFQEVKHAYEILKDDKLRKEYDETGTIRKHGDMRSRARDQLARMFFEIVASPFEGNLIDELRKTISDVIKDYPSDKIKKRKKLAKLKLKIERVKSKSDINLYRGVIEQMIIDVTKNIERSLDNVEIGGIMLEMLDEYEDTAPDIKQDVAFTAMFINMPSSST